MVMQIKLVVVVVNWWKASAIANTDIFGSLCRNPLGFTKVRPTSGFSFAFVFVFFSHIHVYRIFLNTKLFPKKERASTEIPRESRWHGLLQD